MATRTFTNGGVNNLWSTAGNWDTPPADDDTVVIASGQTCEFDVDTSGWANGINGMTITGTLKVSKTTSSYMKMKAATLITGAGTFNIGESGAGNNIPFTTKFTLTGGAGWYIDGNAGLTMTVYGTEPSIKSIKISGAEAAGQTELSVDTDVTGDIWAAGDTIRIDDLITGETVDTEERVIAAGGIASGAITITSGITNAKQVGAYIHLVSRNVKIIAVGTGTRTIYRVGSTSQKLIIGSGAFLGVNKIMLDTCKYAVIDGGVFNYNAPVISGGTYTTVNGGVFTAGNFISSTTTVTITGGVVTCAGTAIGYSYGITITGGVFQGCNYTFLLCAGVKISGGTFHGGYSLFAGSDAKGANSSITGGTFTSQGNYYLQAVCGVDVSNVTMGFCSSLLNVTFNNCVLNGSTEVTLASSEYDCYVESFNHDQNAGAFKAWSTGGITSSQASVLPTGYSVAFLTPLTSAIAYGYWKRRFIVPAGESVSIDVQLRKSASMTYLPRVYLSLTGESPIWGSTPIDSFTMTDSTDTWESDTFTIDNSAGTVDKEYTLWFVGKNATGNMYSACDITTAGGGGGGSVKIVPLGGIRL